MSRPKTEQFRRECEARDWIRRINEKRLQSGARAAAIWWESIKRKILENRGQAALQLLIDDMNKERNAKGGKN